MESGKQLLTEIVVWINHSNKLFKEEEFKEVPLFSMPVEEKECSLCVTPITEKFIPVPEFCYLYRVKVDGKSKPLISTTAIYNMIREDLELSAQCVRKDAVKKLNSLDIQPRRFIEYVANSRMNACLSQRCHQWLVDNPSTCSLPLC